MKNAGHAYKQHPVDSSWDAIVIGSGIGGLAAAALLARHGGKRVLVLERHYTAGGFTHVFRRPGYEWDVGVHYIGQVSDPSSPVRAAFDHLTGGRLQWHPMPEVYDRILIAGRAYDFPAGLERLRDRMAAYFPSCRAAIDHYLAAVVAAASSSRWYFAEKAIPAPIARLAGPLLRSRFLRYARRSTLEVLRDITREEELIAVLTGQWGDYGLPPAASSFGIHAIIAHHYFDGAAYPAGGASEIAAGMAPLIEEAGGAIIVGAEVSQILVHHGRAAGVRMADGREFRAKIVISDAGAINTITRLLPPAAAPAVESLVRQIRGVPPSMSHLCLYVGLRGGAEELGLSGTNLWVCPAPDHDANVVRFEADPESPFPVLFISFPSAKDPSFAARYPARATIEVVSPVPYRFFERWAETRWKKRGPDYDSFKQRFSARLLAELERHVPSVRGRIDYSELSTPLSTRHFANFQRGEIYGLSAVPARFELRSLGARTPVRNLFLTGADAATLGVTGAMFGGVIAASLALGRNLLSAVSKPLAASRSLPALPRSQAAA